MMKANLPEYFLTNCDLGDENDWGGMSLMVWRHPFVSISNNLDILRAKFHFVLKVEAPDGK